MIDKTNAEISALIRKIFLSRGFSQDETELLEVETLGVFLSLVASRGKPDEKIRDVLTNEQTDQLFIEAITSVAGQHA
jgi:hypothetical protein